MLKDDGAMPDGGPHGSTPGDDGPEDRNTRDSDAPVSSSTDSDTVDGGNRDGEQDGETPEEATPSFVKPDDLLDQFGINHLAAELMLGGRRPTESMLITQEDMDKTYKEEKDPIASHTKKNFYFSSPPYRPSAVVAYADSPWLMSQLKPITFDDMTLDTHHRGRSIRLTNTGYSRSQYGWMHCGVVDSTGARGRIVLYNIRRDRPVEGVLPRFAEFIIKEPYYTLHCDGKVVVRVDHPSDLIISSPCTTGMDGGLRKFPKKDLLKISGPLFENGHYAHKRGAMARDKKEGAKGDLWFRDAVWLAAEADEPHAEAFYRLYQAQRVAESSYGRGDEVSDFFYLRTTAAIGSRMEFVPLPIMRDPKTDPRNQHNLASLCALLRGDIRTAVEHYNEAVKRWYPERLSTLLQIRQMLNLTEREQEFGEYAEKYLTINADRDYKTYCASFFKRVIVDEDKKCLRAACQIKGRGLISVEQVFEWVHEESLYEDSKSRTGVQEMERIEYFEGDGVPRTMLGPQAALVPAVLEKCMNLFVTTRERTSLFDEIPRDCKLQEPYDAFHIQEVVYRHAIQWETNPKDPANSFQSAAIWPTSAYVRGSDNPNAEGWIINDLLFLNATRKIEEGEVITMRKISWKNNRFVYKKEENYRGGDPEPLMPARSDAPPPPIIDPGAWLFAPEDKPEAGAEQDLMEVAKRILNILPAQLLEKQSQTDSVSGLIKKYTEKLTQVEREASGDSKYREKMVFLMSKINENRKLEKKLKEETKQISDALAQDLEKMKSNLRLKHLVKLLENPPKGNLRMAPSE